MVIFTQVAHYLGKDE